jgi:phage baseplate assembly protein gpV
MVTTLSRRWPTRSAGAVLTFSRPTAGRQVLGAMTIHSPPGDQGMDTRVSQLVAASVSGPPSQRSPVYPAPAFASIAQMGYP